MIMENIIKRSEFLQKKMIGAAGIFLPASVLGRQEGLMDLLCFIMLIKEVKVHWP